MPEENKPTDTTTTILPTDATHPSVREFSCISPFSGNPLDKSKDNWEDWRRAVYISTSLTGMWDYIVGEETKPDPLMEPVAYRHWTRNCRRTTGFIYGALSRNELRACPQPARGTHPSDWFDMLAKRHTVSGASGQIRLIMDALSMRAVGYGPQLLQDIDRIMDIVERVWNIGELKLDTFISALILNYLSSVDSLEELLFQVQERVNSATTESPFDHEAIRDYINMRVEAHRLIDKTPTEGPVLAVRSRQRGAGTSSNTVCSVCKGRYHTAEFCVDEGGDMAGKPIEEAKAAARRARKKNMCPSTHSVKTRASRLH